MWPAARPVDATQAVRLDEAPFNAAVGSTPPYGSRHYKGSIFELHAGVRGAEDLRPAFLSLSAPPIA
jgi:hypothetical protein